MYITTTNAASAQQLFVHKMYFGAMKTDYLIVFFDSKELSSVL